VRALLRLAGFPLAGFPRFCTFARFLRLAMIGPPGLVGVVTGYAQVIADQTANGSLGNLSNEF
jgi:hypothetical protein